MKMPFNWNPTDLLTKLYRSAEKEDALQLEKIIQSLPLTDDLETALAEISPENWQAIVRRERMKSNGRRALSGLWVCLPLY